MTSSLYHIAEGYQVKRVRTIHIRYKTLFMYASSHCLCEIFKMECENVCRFRKTIHTALTSLCFIHLEVQIYSISSNAETYKTYTITPT